MEPSTQSNQNIIFEKPVLFGFATQRKTADGKIAIRFRWFRLFLVTALMFATGWLTVAAALYAHFKYRGDFEAVSYTDMLILPFTLDKHRVKMGDFHVEKGLAAIKDGGVRDGLRLLRLGVARSPGNLEGREAIAGIFEIAFKRHDKASSVLIDGLDHGGIDDTDYLKTTIRQLLRHQMDEEIQDIAADHLPEEADLTDKNRIIAFGAAQANYLRGNFDRADDYLIDYKLNESLEGLLLSSQISWDRGNRQAAITKMERSTSRYPAAEALFMQLSRYHREIGNIDQARRYAILRNVSAPMNAAPRIELLYIYNKSGDTDRELRETRRMLRQFRDDEPALQALANFAADSGNIELARRTYEEALENEFSIDAFALLLIEAHLVNGDCIGALEFSEELLRERPTWLKNRWGIFQSLRAVASYGSNRSDLGEIYLQDFLSEAATQPATYLAIARRFEEIQRDQQARKILATAYQIAPTNQKVLTELIRVELRLGNTENLSRLLSRFLQMRRPQLSLVTEAYQKLGSDRFIFTPDRESLLLELSAIVQENAEIAPKIDVSG
ncbi:MAG: tetratricopeptide repeat protein [Coraliomargaritaceae bacterium]